MTTKFRRIGAFFLVPLLFLVFGYLICYVIGAPVINFVRSSIGIILLNDTPTFTQKHEDIFNRTIDVARNSSEETQEKGSTSTTTTETTTTSATTPHAQTVPASQLSYPSFGSLYGEIQIPRVQVDEHLYYGDSEDVLRLGAGQYNGSVLPGELGTTLIAGHNTSTFNRLDLVNAGDQVNINTSYGNYVYEVTDKKVLTYDDPSAIALLDNYQERNLIMYTCYPVDMLGSTDTRLFVYAKYLSGPVIDESK